MGSWWIFPREQDDPWDAGMWDAASLENDSKNKL